MEETKKTPITFCGFLNRSGYAQACQDYVLALRNGGYDVALRIFHNSIDQLSLTRKKYEMFFNISKPHDERPITIYHCIPDMQKRMPCRNKSIGFATFETYKPPEQWTTILNNNDAVIVPSEFNRKVFLQAGVQKPIHYLPHCVDTELYNPNIQPLKKRENFSFLFVGTWKKRKGWEILIEAWFKEFDKNDNVELVIKTDKILIAQTAIENIKKQLGLKKDFAPIVFESRVLNEVELPQLFKSVDCLICPTFGEGFGYPGLQSMAVGTPIIITNYSGCQDYAKEETATLIEPNKFIVFPQMDQYPQFTNCIWANVEWMEVAKKMRYVKENYQFAKEKTEAGINLVKEKFNYESTVKRFDDIIKSLL